MFHIIHHSDTLSKTNKKKFYTVKKKWVDEKKGKRQIIITKQKNDQFLNLIQTLEDLLMGIYKFLKLLLKFHLQ